MEDTSSDLAETEGKRARPDSPDSVVESTGQKRRRVVESPEVFGEDVTVVEMPEVESIEDDLLSILDDSDDSSDRDPVIHDLDSVIKSFEEEIIVPGQLPPSVVLDPTPEEAQNELGYLLEASDDELGLPPSFANSADESSNPEVPELPDISSYTTFTTPFDGELPNYDTFDLGPEINNNNNIIGGGKEGNEEFVMLGGLFDYVENWDVPEVMWRPESLPAV